MVQQKISQTYIPLVKKLCMGIPSNIQFGGANCGKSSTIQRSAKFIGVESETSSIYKTKATSKAGTRKFIDDNEKRAFYIEDSHVDKSTTMQPVEMVFNFFSDDQELYKSVVESGESKQIFTQTMNEFTLSVHDCKRRDIMNRFILVVWKRTDLSEQLRTDFYVCYILPFVCFHVQCFIEHRIGFVGYLMNHLCQ